MPEQFLHNLYAASITVGLDGSLLVSSTPERMKAWAAVFCFSAALSLAAWLLWRRRRHAGRLALAAFLATLLIPALIIPSIRNESIHASREAIIVESGAWFMPTRTVLKMTDIRNIREYDGGLLPGNLIGDPAIDWHVTWHDGESRILELNEFFNAHRMVVAYYYKDRGYWLERLEDRQRRGL